jgi:hypothetical protein
MGGPKIVMRVVNPYTSNTKMTVRLVYIQRLNQRVENRSGRIGSSIQKPNQIANISINMGVRLDVVAMGQIHTLRLQRMWSTDLHILQSRW